MPRGQRKSKLVQGEPNNTMIDAKPNMKRQSGRSRRNSQEFENPCEQISVLQLSQSPQAKYRKPSGRSRVSTSNPVSRHIVFDEIDNVNPVSNEMGSSAQSANRNQNRNVKSPKVGGNTPKSRKESTTCTQIEYDDGVRLAVDPGEELDFIDDVTEVTNNVNDFDQQVEQLNADMNATVTEVPPEMQSIISMPSTNEGIFTEKQFLDSNPGLRSLFNQFLDEHLKQTVQTGESSGSTLLMSLTPNNMDGKTKGINSGKDKSGVTQTFQGNKSGNMVKLPSDTTIYAPALALRQRCDNATSVQINQFLNENPGC